MHIMILLGNVWHRGHVFLSADNLGLLLMHSCVGFGVSRSDLVALANRRLHNKVTRNRLCFRD